GGGGGCEGASCAHGAARRSWAAAAAPPRPPGRQHPSLQQRGCRSRGLPSGIWLDAVLAQPLEQRLPAIFGVAGHVLRNGTIERDAKRIRKANCKCRHASDGNTAPSDATTHSAPFVLR